MVTSSKIYTIKTLKILLSSNVTWIIGIKLHLKTNTKILVFTVLKVSNIVFFKNVSNL